MDVLPVVSLYSALQQPQTVCVRGCSSLAGRLLWAETWASFVWAGDSRMRTGKLTALKVKNLTAPGRYGDGGGLWLQVRDSHRRSWLFRYARDGKARQMGLGSTGTVSLAEARAAAEDCRRQLQAGADPLSARAAVEAVRKSAASIVTFRSVAERYLAAHESGWKNAKHRLQWSSTLEAHAYPTIGNRSVASITTGDVMTVLEPIWHVMPETASRLRGRIESVLDYAKAREWRNGENPARWRGHISNMLPRRNKARTVQHHAALPWAKMAAFWAELSEESGTAAAALRFAILTAARTSEVVGARWSEIDIAENVWAVPAARMKAGKEHRVPLSTAAVNLLQPYAAIRSTASSDEFVFAGQREGKPLSTMAMAMLLRRMKRDDVTVHGFRSTFRDWCAETTEYPREVAEAALAHALADKVEAAYRRGDLFEKRKAMMEAWAAFCAGGAQNATATNA